MSDYKNTVEEMMKSPYYTPKCACHKCGSNPKMYRTDSGVVCPDCGWSFEFTKEVIENYNKKWNLTYPLISNSQVE